MGVTHCYKPDRCGSRRPAHARAHEPKSAKIVGNSNFSSKRKSNYRNKQVNAQLIGNIAVPVQVLNFSGNAVTISILSNNAIADRGRAKVKQSVKAKGGDFDQRVFQLTNQNNDD